MMTFRFTLSNTISGSQIINEPDGWKDIKLKLERDPEYHCLVEIIDTNFFFYNQNDLVDGGRVFITGIENTQGINAIITLTIQLTQDQGLTYENVFVGTLDLSTIKDISRGDKFYKFQCAIIPSSLWAMFINRKSTVIDLRSTTDLDGNGVAAPTTHNISLSSQIIPLQYQATLVAVTGYDDIAALEYIQFDFDTIVYDEITTKFHLPIDVDPLVPVSLWTLDFAGDLSTTINASFSVGVIPSAPGANLDLFLRVRSSAGNFTDYPFTRSDFGNRSDYNLVFPSTAMGIGYQLILYGRANAPFTSGAGTQLTIKGAQIFMTHESVYPTTTADTLLIHDVADSLVERMSGGFQVYSDYLGGHAQGYPVNGCAYPIGLTLGLHIRGYSFTEKIFSMSFDNFWSGANPILNLGLGSEFVGGVEYLRIESKDHFYNDTPILTFDYVNDIERTHDKSKIFKAIKIGYSSWSAESSSGIDDVQTVHNYSTVFKTIGQDLSIMSSFVTASLAIEQTRRNRKTISKDWRLDNNTIAIALKDTNVSPATFIPEIGSPFTSITGINNPTTRYNIRFSVYRNLFRWLKYISCCLQDYLSTNIKFNSGEGNYVMSVGANSDTCDTGTWTDNQDKAPSSSPYFTQEQYRITVSMSWDDYKLLLLNKTHAISVSPTNTSHKTCHINLLEYDIHKGEAQITAWIK